jgi:hypothetical protein
MINHPDHYQANYPAYETINVIEAWELNFHLGNAVKYIARCDKKGKPIEDLKKAIWYLEREVANREKLLPSGTIPNGIK